jgi:hypothetical protein
MPPVLRRLLAAALIAASALTFTTVASAAKPRVTTKMYNDRYCEILAVKGTIPNLVADVWNTYGLNRCPAAQWKAEDAPAITKRLGALTLRLNGPRYWLVDRATITLAPGMGKIKTFGGIRMREIAQVKVPITNGVPGLAAYTETTVLRANTFTWSKRNRIHELVSPGGKVYVMQAYSQIVDPGVKLAGLSKLGAKLKLPAGWTYRTRKLRRDLSLRTTGKAKVLQDELQNTYQYEPKG